MEELERRKNPQIIIGGNVELLNQALLMPWSTGGSASRGSYWKTVRNQDNGELRLDLRVGNMAQVNAEAALFVWDFSKPETLSVDIKRDLLKLQNKNIPVIFVCCNGEYAQEHQEIITQYATEFGIHNYSVINAHPMKLQGFRELDKKVSEVLRVKIGQNILFIGRKESYELFRHKPDEENTAAAAAKEAPAKSSSDSKKEGNAPLIIPVVELVIATTHGFEQSENEIIGNILWYKYINRSSEEILALAEAQKKSVDDILALAEKELGISDHVPPPAFLNAIDKKLLQAQIVILDTWAFDPFFSQLDAQTQQNFKALIKTKYVIIAHGKSTHEDARKLSDTLGLQEDMREFHDFNAGKSHKVLSASTQKVAGFSQNNNGEVSLQPIEERNVEKLLPIVIIDDHAFNQAYNPMEDADKEKIKAELKSKFVIIESDDIEHAQALSEKLELQRDRAQLRIKLRYQKSYVVQPYADFTNDNGQPISAAEAAAIKDAKREAEELARQRALEVARLSRLAEEEPGRQKIVTQSEAVGTKKSKRASTSSAQYLSAHGMHRSPRSHAVLGGTMMMTGAVGGSALAGAVYMGAVTITSITMGAITGAVALLLLALFVCGLQKLISNTCGGSSNRDRLPVRLAEIN